MKAIIPDKTFYRDDYVLKESDFDCGGRLSAKRTMEFMQNAATAHADILGFGWNALHEKGILWVLSKAKVRFVRPVTRKVKSFTLYTWPLKPDRYFAAREFAAVDCDGEALFYATSLWNLIDIEKRNILTADRMSEFYGGEYSETEAEIPRVFARLKRGEEYSLSYVRQIRRSDLDINMHVNNTNYIAYALDAAENSDVSNITEFEITYHSECRIGDNISVYADVCENAVRVIGEKDGGKTAFTALLKTEEA